MKVPLLKLRTVAEIRACRPDVLDNATLDGAREIVQNVRNSGVDGMLMAARRYDAWDETRPWWYGRDVMQQALESIDRAVREDLERTAEQIRNFASAQYEALRSMNVAVAGGRAGHDVIPVDSAGCYAPAGRFPLPSSLLMGVVTARVAGVRDVWAASPNPGPVMLATAAIAGADGFLAVGGAQAIAALAVGVAPVPRCDMIVGPGNRWVTAAKHLVSATNGVDFLAGPSELVVLADHTANAELIAADLIAQAEHDVDALPVLVSLDIELVERVNVALERQIANLLSPEVARRALNNGGAVICRSQSEAIAAVEELAPEHLQLSIENAADIARVVRNAGAVFVGEKSGEVLGDYGFGPNHILPTGGGARSTGGLSVFTFLRIRTWLHIDQGSDAIARAARVARLEGLEGHARAAEMRIGTG